MKTKSGIMCGMGETKEEIFQTLRDLRTSGVSIVTLGQYMQPTPRHLAVSEYIHPDTFLEYKNFGLEIGFTYVESGPLVRSSYHAERHL
jgi:lipoic acid synthetase